MAKTHISVLLLFISLVSCAPRLSRDKVFYETTAETEILINKPVDIDRFKSLLVVPWHWPIKKRTEFFEEVISYKDFNRKIIELNPGSSLTKETAKLYFKEQPFLYIKVVDSYGYPTSIHQAELINPESSEVIFSVRSSGREALYAIKNQFNRYLSKHSDSF